MINNVIFCLRSRQLQYQVWEQCVEHTVIIATIARSELRCDQQWNDARSPAARDDVTKHDEHHETSAPGRDLTLSTDHAPVAEQQVSLATLQSPVREEIQS